MIKPDDKVKGWVIRIDCVHKQDEPYCTNTTYYGGCKLEDEPDDECRITLRQATVQEVLNGEAVRE